MIAHKQDGKTADRHDAEKYEREKGDQKALTNAHNVAPWQAALIGSSYPVAHTAHCFDEVAISANFLAQILDVHVNGPVVYYHFVPHRLEQIFPRKDPLTVPRQQAEEVVLQRRKRDLLASVAVAGSKVRLAVLRRRCSGRVRHSKLYQSVQGTTSDRAE